MHCDGRAASLRCCCRCDTVARVDHPLHEYASAQVRCLLVSSLALAFSRPLALSPSRRSAFHLPVHNRPATHTHTHTRTHTCTKHKHAHMCTHFKADAAFLSSPLTSLPSSAPQVVQHVALHRRARRCGGGRNDPRGEDRPAADKHAKEHRIAHPPHRLARLSLPQVRQRQRDCLGPPAPRWRML